MAIYIGNTSINDVGKIQIGSTNVREVWLGNTKIWPSEVTDITFQADYIMIKFIFTDGQDFDTRTKIISPIDSGYLGFSRLDVYPASPAPILLDWGGDNTGVGNADGSTAEAILINLINYRTAYPNNATIQIECRGFWYNAIGTQPVILEATLWKGGNPIKGTPYRQFSNPTAQSTAVLDSIGKVIYSNVRDDGQLIGVFTYNNTSNVGQFST